MMNSNQETISVIIPFFNGTRYIKRIIDSLNVNTKNLSGFKLELLIVNDNPDEIVDSLNTKYYVTKVFNTGINRGIQGARIFGLEQSTGKYVHFLDQDDNINPSFYSDMISRIGDDDVVFCRCMDGDRPTYTYDRVFESASEPSNILNRPPMISPGQAIIKKSSIPVFWKTHILKNIGSDDYMLWLCMMAKGCTFATCNKILFHHVRTGGNYSSDILKANISDREMAQVLADSGLFSEEQKIRIHQIPELQLNRKYKAMLRGQRILYTLEALLKYEEKGFGLVELLKKQNIYTVAIFGAALLGERIKGILNKGSIKTVFYIDSNAPFIKQDIPVIEPEFVERKLIEGELSVPDAIIISFVDEEERFIKSLPDMKGIKVFTILSLTHTISEKWETHL